MSNRLILAATVVGFAALVGLGGGVLLAVLQDDPGEQVASQDEPTQGGSAGPGGQGAPDPTENPTKPSEPVGSTSGELLYFAGGAIRDGDQIIKFGPEGAVFDLMSAAGGWLVLDSEDGREMRLVLVRENSKYDVLDTGQIGNFDVAADGTSVVYPKFETGEVIVRSLDTTEITAQVEMPKNPPYSAEFAGDELIVTTAQDRDLLGQVDVFRVDPGSSQVAELHPGRLANAVSPDGSLVALSRWSEDESPPCPEIAPTQRRIIFPELSCDVRTFGNRGAFSPTGKEIMTVDWRADGLGPAWIDIYDTKTGVKTARLSEELMTSAVWLGDGSLAVVVARDGDLTRYSVLTCTPPKDCTKAVDVSGNTGVVLGRRA